MSKNTAWGTKAYKEAIAAGLSKAKAKEAQVEANRRWWQKVGEWQLGRSGEVDLELYDFNHQKNSGSWHGAEDL